MLLGDLRHVLVIVFYRVLKSKTVKITERFSLNHPIFLLLRTKNIEQLGSTSWTIGSLKLRVPLHPNEMHIVLKDSVSPSVPNTAINYTNTNV